MQFILEYWAQWAFALMGGAVLAAIPKITALWQAVLALLHDRIYTECYHFLSLGHITPDGLRNLTYLYKTYHTMGGNGTGTELYNRATALPIHDCPPGLAGRKATPCQHKSPLPAPSPLPPSPAPLCWLWPSSTRS